MANARSKVAALALCAAVGFVLRSAAASDGNVDQELTMVDPAAGQVPFNLDAQMTSDQTLALTPVDDSSALPASIMPKYECTQEPYKCKATEFCPLGDGVICHVTQCGKGNCPYCGDLGNLIYAGYCAYGCMKGDQDWGYGFNLITRFSNNMRGFVCLPHAAMK